MTLSSGVTTKPALWYHQYSRRTGGSAMTASGAP